MLIWYQGIYSHPIAVPAWGDVGRRFKSRLVMGRLIYLEDDIVKKWAKSFYKSKAWRQCRDAFFVAKHGLCERCGGPGKIVHHKVYLTPQNIDDPNVSLNWDNLELLCQDCHNKEHHRNEAVANGLIFDEDGNLVTL